MNLPKITDIKCQPSLHYNMSHSFSLSNMCKKNTEEGLSEDESAEKSAKTLMHCQNTAVFKNRKEDNFYKEEIYVFWHF